MVNNSAKVDTASFINEMSELMKRHGVTEHVVVYTLIPAGSILSFTSDAALKEAHGLITARVHKLTSPSTNPL